MIGNLGEDYYKNEFLKSYENMEICCKDNVNSVKLYEYCDTEKEFIGVTELVILKQLNNTFKIMVNNFIVHRDIKLESIFLKYKNNEKSEYIVKLVLN